MLTPEIAVDLVVESLHIVEIKVLKSSWVLEIVQR